MWETRNTNIDSHEKTGNSKSVIEFDEGNHSERNTDRQPQQEQQEN